MTPAPKPRRISREEAIRLLRLPSEGWCYMGDESSLKALRMAIRALKREQKAADAKKKEPKR